MSGVDQDLLRKADEVLHRVWGFSSFRPLQQEAVAAALSGRDSVVVLPTGGGKSLCFQVPALCLPGLAVVVSPLISLMKDQVDSLQAYGVSAGFINSSQSSQQQRDMATQIRSGQLKLLYLAPERLLNERMLQFLSETQVSLFAIDEAHCISDWGHDFRPEYRGLRELKERFPKVAVHAYTATAPEHVRQDIVKQLGLREAELLVGSFDRPNLLYRMTAADGRMHQVADVISRHRGESGIVYCISRKEVERMTAALCQLGVKAVAYHAGMNDEARKQNQEAFIRDTAEVVVATVAFGMGIDKPNVRFVIHSGMPKSIEHYQQESGRAGRDGLEAECVMLYSGADLMTWKKMLDDAEPSVRSGALRALNAAYHLCANAVCRHRAISAYFGQNLAADNCGACDVCLGEVDQIEDPMTVGQKVLSCVLRLDQRFGADYTAKVLTGSSEKRIIDQRHDQLSTYGLLRSEGLPTVRQWIEQLVSQEFLSRQGEYQTLQVTARGKLLLRREAAPVLTQPAARTADPKSRRTATVNQSWDGVDRDLFECLRKVRIELATERQVPAYVIFGDTTLRELARVRPSSRERMHAIRGIGQQKWQDFSEIFFKALDDYCGQHSLTRDCQDVPSPVASPNELRVPNTGMGALAAFEYFRKHASVAEVVEKMNRATSTVVGYLIEYLKHDGIDDPRPWVEEAKIAVIQAAVDQAAADNTYDGRLRPIFEALNGAATYDEIRIVITCHHGRQAAQEA